MRKKRVVQNKKDNYLGGSDFMENVRIHYQN